MRKVVVVTDSSTCLPASLVDELGIDVLPISVYLPEGDYELAEQPDEATLVLPEGTEADELAAANRPFVTEYLAAMEQPDYDAAIVITPAVEFATMYRNAVLAAELTDRPVAAVDSRSAAAGQALVVLAGAEAARRGASLEEVLRVVEAAIDRVDLVASLATLEPIRRSGPLPEDVLGEASPVHDLSLFRMRGGNVEPLGTADTTELALEQIAATYAQAKGAGIERVTVFHADAPAHAARLVELMGGVDFVSGFSVAMQIHTGRGVVGAAWLPRRADVG
jgi:DegV family protein with EDD domain